MAADTRSSWGARHVTYAIADDGDTLLISQPTADGSEMETVAASMAAVVGVMRAFERGALVLVEPLAKVPFRGLTLPPAREEAWSVVFVGPEGPERLRVPQGALEAMFLERAKKARQD